MDFKVENSKLIIKYSGKIDSTNANDVSNQIDEIIKNNTCEKIVFDAEDLLYISSAGLRIMLKIKKAVDDFSIVNASLDVYDIFQMTGFTEIIDVAKAMRKLSVDGCPVIGSGAKGLVYRYNSDTIVKVYKSLDCLDAIKNERELARKAFVLGIPTAISYDIVKVGDKYGSVFELLDANSFTQLIVKDTSKIDYYVEEYTNLLKSIHTTNVKPTDMPNAKEKIVARINNIKDYISGDSYDSLIKLVEELPETMNMLHNDYHTNNIMVQNGEAILIDMDTLSYGHPVFELANIYVAYVGFAEADPMLVERFMGMPYQMAYTFFEKFSHLYFNDKNYEECMDKVKVMAYTRLINHFYRRGEGDKPYTIKFKQILEELLNKVDSLYF